MTLSILPLTSNPIEKAILARKEKIYLTLENLEEIQQLAKKILVNAIEATDKKIQRDKEINSNWLIRILFGTDRINYDEYAWVLTHLHTYTKPIDRSYPNTPISMDYLDRNYIDAFFLLVEAGLIKDYNSPKYYAQFYIPPNKLQFARDLRDKHVQLRLSPDISPPSNFQNKRDLRTDIKAVKTFFDL